jgi:hypothetical protein
LDLTLADLFTHQTETTHYWSDAERIEYARRLWRQSRCAIGTVAEQYLRGRGITIPPPPPIRFLPRFKHREDGWAFPVMIAGIQDPNGNFSGVSITWSSADGSGKAPVDPARKIFGPYRSGSVRLAPASDRLVLSEGLETGLSVAQACADLPVWCALSATNLPHLAIPPEVNTVFIAADADPAGEAAALTTAARLRSEGRHVRIARPPTGMDFNDILMGRHA